MADRPQEDTILIEFKSIHVTLLVELVQQAIVRNRKNPKNLAAYMSVMDDIGDSLEQELEAAQREVRTKLTDLEVIMRQES